MSGQRVTATTDERGVIYRGGERWARITLRDGILCPRPTCFEVELSDGTRFGGEMSFDFVDRRCLAWAGWGER